MKKEKNDVAIHCTANVLAMLREIDSFAPQQIYSLDDGTYIAYWEDADWNVNKKESEACKVYSSLQPLLSLEGEERTRYGYFYICIDRSAIDDHFLSEWNDLDLSMTLSTMIDIPADAGTAAEQGPEGSFDLKVSEEERPQFLADIIDVFDDFLIEKDIRIASSDEEMRENDVDPEENEARLYGSDYFQLEEDVAAAIENWNRM
jgi:hypothetical protein